MTPKEYREKASSYFKEGYNCAQAVLLTFASDCGLDDTTALRIASSFGGGMGRLREVCGAVSGMFMAAGLLYGYESKDDREGKIAQYTLVQELAAKFRDKNGAIVCRELLGLNHKTDVPVPEERTPQYYQKRQCTELVGDAAEILAEYITERNKK